MRKRYQNGSERSQSYALSAIGKIGHELARLIRNTMMVRAFAILPITRQNESEIKRLLAK